MKIPRDLGPAGRELLRFIRENYNVEEAAAGPLVLELCRIQDALSDIRRALKTSGIVDEKGRRNPLLTDLARLSGLFSKHWKLAGFADPMPDAPQRPRGRPDAAAGGV